VCVACVGLGGSGFAGGVGVGGCWGALWGVWGGGGGEASCYDLGKSLMSCERLRHEVLSQSCDPVAASSLVPAKCWGRLDNMPNSMRPELTVILYVVLQWLHVK